MKKNNKPRIIVLTTLAGLTVVFLGAAIISFQNATKAHQNSHYMKMTRTYVTQQPTFTEVLFPAETAVPSTKEIDSVAETAVPTHTTIPTATPSPTETPPPPTLTAWEEVQQQVSALRSRLERGSDGYQGLSTALEESEPNETWCSNLLIAVQDFNYVNDTAGAETIRALAEAHNCP